MKPLLNVLLLGLSLSSQAENLQNNSAHYSGLWQGDGGTYYSIHQIEASENSESQIVISALSTQEAELGPFEQGNIQFTENIFDIAINGSGFFILLKEDGSELYTRNGKFSINSEGWIVNEDGYRLKTVNQLAIPEQIPNETKKRAFILSEIPTLCLSEVLPNGMACSTSANVEEMISINLEGVILVKDSNAGEMVEHDQIILASIYPKDLRFSEQYYYYSDNPSSVVYSVSHASLQAAAIERRSYTSQTWQAYSATLVEGKGELKSADSIPMSDWNGQSIEFTSELTAVIKQTCDEEHSYICDLQNVRDDILTRLY